MVAGLIIIFNIQGKFGGVNDKIGSGLRFPASPFRLRRAGKVQRLNEDKGAKRICKSKRWNVIVHRPDGHKCNRDFIGRAETPVPSSGATPDK